MENKRSIEYYESHMWDVKLEDITSSKDNAEILRQLRDNDPYFTSITLTNSAMDYDDFVVGTNDDLGWVGYFIGRNTQLYYFYIFTWLEGEPDHSKIDALAHGLSLNRSISTLSIDTEFGEPFLQRFGNFLRSNKNLTHLYLAEFDIGLETARNLALMLRDGMSLESFHVERLCYDSDSDDFTDEGAVTAEVITSLSKHTKVECLHLWTCNLDGGSCIALGRLSSLKELKLFHSKIDFKGMKALTDNMFCCLGSLEIYSTSIEYEKEVTLSSGLAKLQSLKKLNLTNSIDNDALQCVAAAIANNATVEVLNISENNSITAKGLSSLSSLLQSDKCCLRELVLQGMHIGDDGAVALAEALAGNKSLKCLKFYDHISSTISSTSYVEHGITAIGRSAFTRLLCDTSSINNTFLSNHTLERCDTSDVDRDFEDYLWMNKHLLHVAMQKILESHADFDMKPLFQWQLKLLPLMIAWFGLARARWRESIDSLQHREISAIFQFVRGLPLLTVAGWQNVADTESKKRKFDHL